MNQTSSKNKGKLRRIRIVYSIFAAITVVGLALYFLNFFVTEGPTPFEHHHGKTNLVITDLPSGAPLYSHPHAVSTDDADISLTSHVSRFDVEIHADMAAYSQYDHGRTTWVMTLQIAKRLCFIAAIVLTLWFIVVFYINLKRGKAFPSKHISLVTIIGILIILMAICGDVSTFIERQLAFDIMEHTEWVPEVNLTLHISQIAIGLVIAFLAELFRAGGQIQEEQDLTI